MAPLVAAVLTAEHRGVPGQRPCDRGARQLDRATYALAMSSDDPAARAGSSRVRSLVVEAVEAAAALIAGDEVAARWDEPSALDGMTVGALAAHLVRAAGATLAYLDRTDPAARPDGALLTPVTYFHAAIDSPIHERIRDVSASEATA